MVRFEAEDLDSINGERFRPYIKVLLISNGCTLSVDFKEYVVTQPSLFFVNSNQYLYISEASVAAVQMIFYNRDFYCVQIHDAEVACDGLLFNNIFEMPQVTLEASDWETASHLFDQIADELENGDASSEEMIRTYLKQMIIRATREWKKQNLDNGPVPIPAAEQDFFRNFSRLVDIHFREKHSVADYAQLLNIAPKTLSSKFNKMHLENPNEAIKNRILLEAKRLLIYTDLSIKEIAYQLGYEDPAYFNRLFTQKLAQSPAFFRKKEKNA